MALRAWPWEHGWARSMALRAWLGESMAGWEHGSVRAWSLRAWIGLGNPPEKIPLAGPASPMTSTPTHLPPRHFDKPTLGMDRAYLALPPVQIWRAPGPGKVNGFDSVCHMGSTPGPGRINHSPTWVRVEPTSAFGLG